MTATRLANSLEVAMSWVITRKLLPTSSLIRLSTFMMLAWVSTSRAEVGSSIMTRSGLATSAMAMTTLCLMPPLSSKA